MICVKNLMKLDSFQNTVLVAGSSGVYRRVSWPNIAQTASISEWLVGGDVILMTGVGLKNTAEFLNDVIRQAAEGDAACLIILLSDSLIPQIPQETILYANQLKFPLFAAPWETQIANVIRDISSLILSNQYEEDSINELLEALLFRDSVFSAELMHGFLEKNHLFARHKVVVAQCQWKSGESLEGGVGTLPFQRQVNGLLIQELKAVFPQSLYINRNQNLIFLVRLDAVPEQHIKDALFRLKNDMRAQYPKLEVSFGIGRAYSESEQFGRSCQEALKALSLSNGCGVTAFAELGILQLLMEIPDQDAVRSYAVGQLAPLIDYDEKYRKNLLATLETYLSTNCNYVKTAKLMYLHRNTLVYQIDKIKDLTGLPLEQAEIRNHLFNCLKIYRYSR